jgi:hypothetical protein
MRPYGEQTGKAEPRIKGAMKKPPRYRRAKREAEETAAWRKPRKAERRRAKQEIDTQD